MTSLATGGIYINPKNYSKAVLEEGAILAAMVGTLNNDISTIHDLVERLTTNQNAGNMFTLKQHIKGGDFCLMLDGLYFDIE
jgi:hypothetical protein